MLDLAKIDYYSIGQRIRTYRKKINLSQESLAEKVGISLTHMSHIETGNTKLSLAVLVDISRVLEVSVDDLLFIKDNDASTFSKERINYLINSCNQQEIKLIEEIIYAIKKTISKEEDINKT